MSSKTAKKKSTAAQDSKNNVFTVEKVLDKRTGRGGRVEYYIQWQGFPEGDSTWEPRENLQCTAMINEFEQEYAKRERPSRKRKVSAGSDDDVDPNDKFSLNGKQLKCLVGLTKGPGELHFLCRFSDDTARLLPAKEVNTRYRPFVDEYGCFLRRKLERKRKGEEDEEGEDWPKMPPGYRILSEEEQRIKMIAEEEAKVPRSPDMGGTPTPSDILHDLQQSASESELLSSDPPGHDGEASNMSDSVLAVFDDRHESPAPCAIIVDTILRDDDDDMLFGHP